MDHHLICTWLGLPANGWPPDHYTLLGLAPGEQDCARIEHHVHERLARLRCYQLSHPGPATEAMNRLAQAFICLTDCEAKRAYDAQCFPHLAARPESPPAAQPQLIPPSQIVVTLPPPAAPAVTPNADTAVSHGGQTQLDWRDATPPPVRSVTLPDAVAANGVAPAPVGPVNVPPPVAPPASAPAVIPTAKPVDPVFETARSPEARRGLRTRRDLLERVLTTRRLLRAWGRARKYLARPRRKLARAAEETELTRVLERIDELLLNFPDLLGQPGQPGYRVLALTHDDKPAAMFKALDAGQRDALALDWLAGQALLMAHRQFLRQEMKRLRRRGPLARLGYAVRAAVHDHPGWVSFGLLSVIAATVALFLLR